MGLAQQRGRQAQALNSGPHPLSSTSTQELWCVHLKPARSKESLKLPGILSKKSDRSDWGEQFSQWNEMHQIYENL